MNLLPQIVGLCVAALLAVSGFAQQTAAVSLAPPAFPTPTPVPPFPLATAIPTEPASLSLNHATWTLVQPRLVAPNFALNRQGIVWLRFPQMFTDDTIRQKNLPPVATADYDLMFTPWRTDGGPLDQAADLLVHIPGRVAGEDVTVGTLTPAGDERFVFSTYQQARDDGPSVLRRVFWVEPSTKTILEVVAGRVGGGSFLTLAQGRRWLFWSRYEVDERGWRAGGAGLIDLRTGANRPVVLGGGNLATFAEWRPNGRLYLVRGAEQQACILDPDTGVVEPIE